MHFSIAEGYETQIAFFYYFIFVKMRHQYSAQSSDNYVCLLGRLGRVVNDTMLINPAYHR